jgi:hypothetical protein
MNDCLTAPSPDDRVDPNDRASLARRIVEVTDQDESLFMEFVPVDPRPLTFNR